MLRTRRTLVIAAVAALLTPAARAQYNYTFFGTPDPTTSFFAVRGLNDSGLVVGGTRVQYASNVGHAGYIRQPSGAFTTYAYPGSQGTLFTGINNSNFVVGNALMGYSGTTPLITPFLYYNGNVAALPVSYNAPGYTQVPIVNGINNYNTSVGYVNLYGQAGSSAVGFVVYSQFQVGFFLVGNQPTYATGIADSGVIVGTVGAPGQYGTSGPVPFIRNPADGSYIAFTVPGAVPGSYQVFGMNNSGLVVGTCDIHVTPTSVGTFSWLRYPSGTITIFGVPNPQTWTDVFVTSINNNNQIAGVGDGGQYNYTGFIGTPAGAAPSGAAGGLAAAPAGLTTRTVREIVVGRGYAKIELQGGAPSGLRAK